MPELLSTQTIERDLAGLAGWEYTDGKLRRTYERKGFLSATSLVNAIAYLANESKHHPDITLHDYNQVTVTLVTHAEGGVTRYDVDLARSIETLVAEPIGGATERDN